MQNSFYKRCVVIGLFLGNLKVLQCDSSTQSILWPDKYLVMTQIGKQHLSILHDIFKYAIYALNMQLIYSSVSPTTTKCVSGIAGVKMRTNPLTVGLIQRWSNPCATTWNSSDAKALASNGETFSTRDTMTVPLHQRPPLKFSLAALQNSLRLEGWKGFCFLS